MASARIERCDVWELSRKGLSLDGRIAVQDMPRLASQLVDVRDRLEFRFSGGTDSRGRPAAVLELHGTVHAACDRCGKPVPLPLHEQAAFFFVADETELGRLPIDESPDEPLLGSPRFDLAALIEDQAILAMPLSPRHEDCDAVDPRTGPEPEVPRRQPFAVLAGLKKRGS
jgi:uncharacterized protein